MINKGKEDNENKSSVVGAGPSSASRAWGQGNWGRGHPSSPGCSEKCVIEFWGKSVSQQGQRGRQ